MSISILVLGVKGQCNETEATFLACDTQVAGAVIEGILDAGGNPNSYQDGTVVNLPVDLDVMYDVSVNVFCG